ncbi:MAG: hypothetical protein QXO84_01850 [Candidatus Aenigmatarchaeota archaeon]
MNAKLLLLLLIPICASKTLGVFPTNETVVINPFTTLNFAFYLLNPSDEDVYLTINLSCVCNKEIYQYADVYPKQIIVEKNTTLLNPKPVLVRIKNPLFLEKKFKGVKFIQPIFGQKQLSCRLSAVSEGQTSLTITSQLNAKLVGINPLKLFALIFLLSFLLAIFLLRA